MPLRLIYPYGPFWMLLAVFVLGASSTTLTAVAVDALALLLLPVLFDKASRAAILAEPFFRFGALAIGLLAIAFAFNSEQFADMKYLGNFLPVLLAAPVYAVARRISGRRMALVIAIACVIGAAASVAAGIYDVILLHHSRTQGYLSSALVIARLGALFGFVSAAGFFLVRDKRRYLFCIGPMLAVIAAFFAGARGTLIAVPPVALLFFAFVLTDRHNANRRGTAIRLIVGATAALALVVIAFSGSRAMLLFGSLMAEIFNGVHADNSIDFRLQFYHAGWQLFTASPLIGYGWADIPRMAFTILSPDDFGGRYSSHFFHFHDDFLNFAVAAGCLGIAAWLLLLAAPVAGALAARRQGLHQSRLYAATTISLLYFITGLTDISFGWDMPTTAYAMLTALVLGSMTEIGRSG